MTSPETPVGQDLQDSVSGDSGMTTSAISVVCSCGKEFRVANNLSGPDSIRCHVCGQLVEVPFRKAAIVEALAESERRTIAHAEKMNFAGIQFDGAYCTSTPVVLDSDFGETLSFMLAFKRDLTLGYEYRLEEPGGEVQKECDNNLGCRRFDSNSLRSSGVLSV